MCSDPDATFEPMVWSKSNVTKIVNFQNWGAKKLEAEKKNTLVTGIHPPLINIKKIKWGKVVYFLCDCKEQICDYSND